MKLCIISIFVLTLLGCTTTQVTLKPSTVGESLLVKCRELPTYTDYNATDVLVKDQLKYTLFLISEYGDCAASKDKLVEAVRVIQTKQSKREQK